METSEPATRPLDSEYWQARAALDEPANTSQGLVLVVSMVLFAFSMSSKSEPVRQIVITLGVLVVHELGHFLGMRGFGYRDVRMFFIPFFGAAVSGKSRGVAAWKDGIVSLLGPMPGLVLALVLSQVWSSPSPLQRDAVNTLIIINVLNLLPLGGFDGSRFLQRVVFSRHRLLEIGFLAVVGVALLGLAIQQRMWVIAIFAYFGLVLVPHRHRILREAERLRPELAGAKDARKLDDERGYALFLAAHDATHERNRSKPKVVATAMDEIVEATRRPPGALASVGLIGVWLLGFVVAVVAFASTMPAAAMPAKPFAKLDFPGGGFRISMPKDSEIKNQPGDQGSLSIGTMHGTSAGIIYEVRVETFPLAFPLEAQVAGLEANLKNNGVLSASALEPATLAGVEGRTATLTSRAGGPEHCRAAYLFDGARTITLMACSGEPGHDPELEALLKSLERVP